MAPPDPINGGMNMFSMQQQRMDHAPYGNNYMFNNMNNFKNNSNVMYPMNKMNQMNPMNSMNPMNPMNSMNFRKSMYECPNMYQQQNIQPQPQFPPQQINNFSNNNFYIKQENENPNVINNNGSTNSITNDISSNLFNIVTKSFNNKNVSFENKGEKEVQVNTLLGSKDSMTSKFELFSSQLQDYKINELISNGNSCKFSDNHSETRKCSQSDTIDFTELTLTQDTYNKQSPKKNFISKTSLKLNQEEPSVTLNSIKKASMLPSFNKQSMANYFQYKLLDNNGENVVKHDETSKSEYLNKEKITLFTKNIEQENLYKLQAPIFIEDEEKVDDSINCFGPLRKSK
jgi:hypothetical protein